MKTHQKARRYSFYGAGDADNPMGGIDGISPTLPLTAPCLSGRFFLPFETLKLFFWRENEYATLD